MMLLERLLLLFLPSFIFVSPDDLSGGGLVLGAKASVRGTSREDRFAVLLGVVWLYGWCDKCSGVKGISSGQNVCLYRS